MCWLSLFLHGFSGRVRGKDPVEELQVTETLEVDLKYKGNTLFYEFQKL